MVEFAGWDGWQVHDEAGRRKYLSSVERVRFLQAADTLAPATRTFCHVLVYAGCRISEALALTVHHVDTDRMRLTIRTLKRRRVVFRHVPMPEATIRMLFTLPLDADGRFWTMHRATAWRAVKATMFRAGVTGPMASPKGLRHGFGICAADHNMSPEPDSALVGPRLSDHDCCLP